MEGCVRGEALPMVGGAYERGIAQASHAKPDEVLNAINLRLDQNEGVFENSVVREYLNKQWEFAQKHCREELNEMIGIADGFDICSLKPLRNKVVQRLSPPSPVSQSTPGIVIGVCRIREPIRQATQMIQRCCIW